MADGPDPAKETMPPELYAPALGWWQQFAGRMADSLPHTRKRDVFVAGFVAGCFFGARNGQLVAAAARTMFDRTMGLFGGEGS